MSQYQDRINKERLARQAPDVKQTAHDLRETMKSIEQYLYWALDPDEKDGGAYYTQNIIDHAHSLIDYAHAYRQALKANPPPKEDEETDGNEIPSIS